MPNFIHDIGIEAVESGFADDLAEYLLSLWKRDKGIEGEGLIKAAPHLVWMAGIRNPDLAPPILMAGPKSLTAQVLGADSAATPADLEDMVGTDYRQFAASAYSMAMENRAPQFDLVSSEFTARAEALSFRLVYERLILPYQTEAGIPHLILYSRPIEFRMQGRALDHQGQTSDFQLATSGRDLRQPQVGASSEYLEGLFP
ncbi:hypothetical protein [Breoghania sp.]|uniref:hypothetical protein n=1 Tax=Breoghania sp. TaxID=2065378 RepID=UPI002AABB8A5|nr:hypothetical protein [Breoghania sp.]